MAMEKDLQRVEDAVEGLGRLFHSQEPAVRRARRAGVELSRTAQKLLWHVVTESPIRISDLGKSVGMADAIVSRQVKTMEELGLVERIASKDDGRVALVRPTPSGRAAGRRLRRAADEIFREQMAGWSARALGDLASHLERLLVDVRGRPR